MTLLRLKLLDWLLITLLAGAVAATGWCSAHWWRARERASSADAEVSRVRDLLAALARVRAREPVLAEGVPTGDQLSLVSDALGRAGLPVAVLRRVQPEGDGAGDLGNDMKLPVRRIGMRIELDALTLPELGRLLGAWRSQNPSWIPVLINLSARPDNPREGQASLQAVTQWTTKSVSPRWTVSLSMAVVYLVVKGYDARAETEVRPQVAVSDLARRVSAIERPSQGALEPLVSVAMNEPHSVGWEALTEVEP